MKEENNTPHHPNCFDNFATQFCHPRTLKVFRTIYLKGDICFTDLKNEIGLPNGDRQLDADLDKFVEYHYLLKRTEKRNGNTYKIYSVAPNSEDMIDIVRAILKASEHSNERKIKKDMENKPSSGDDLN